MALPTKRELADIKRRVEQEHNASLPPIPKIRVERQNILYCGGRDRNIIAKKAHRAKVKYYTLQAQLLKAELIILRAKLPPFSTRTISDGDRVQLEELIRVKQRENHIFRDWLRHNKEYDK